MIYKLISGFSVPTNIKKIINSHDLYHVLAIFFLTFLNKTKKGRQIDGLYILY